ncbi:MauE/DoxX family redox-associated membrane protein [Sphaerisporangium sp. TRM90804]|uniref:MauE/DoxX family redox-associated membrane protein n=1 Tax=Sphaerisporangium sp. TRM90804 TaxID=3031113 RepID=UPI002449704A|nr:MauE/DoxX family redox-associated membrane protein [Sphaerisporangium sp. TRM90804]MDH2428558.1 MauE/DoxX family redox-associated membrane protein [Sphaerisporangium sp. TRM90804]
MRSLYAHAAVPWVTTVARLVVAGVLIAAGWLKIGTPALSVQAVEAYELLPAPVASVVGHGLPIVEIVVGVLLVVGLLTRAAGVVSALLMLAFVVGIASAWARGLRIDCGCFGGGGPLAAGREPEYLWEILRDGGLFLLGAWIAWFSPGRLSLDRALGLVAEPRRAGAVDGEWPGDDDDGEEPSGGEIDGEEPPGGASRDGGGVFEPRR